MQNCWDDYDRFNTPSEDERAQNVWDDVDRELLGPDYKRILEVHDSRCNAWRDLMIGDAGGAGEAATGATEPRRNTPLLIKTALAAAALAEIASGKKKKKSHKKSKNTSKKKSKKGKFASDGKKSKSAKDKAAAQNAV